MYFIAHAEVSVVSALAAFVDNDNASFARSRRRGACAPFTSCRKKTYFQPHESDGDALGTDLD